MPLIEDAARGLSIRLRLARTAHAMERVGRERDLQNGERIQATVH